MRRLKLPRFVNLLFLLFVVPPAAHAQGFGNGKKTVVLHARLPAAIHFTGNSFTVTVTPHQQSYTEVAQTLGDLLPTELQKDDSSLHEDAKAADLVITCNVTSFETPPHQKFQRNEVALEKGKSPEKAKDYYKVTGNLTVSYQAKSKGRVLDSDNIESKYSEDFEADTNAQANESVGSKVVDPFKRLAGKKTEETATAPTPLELRNILVARVIKQIAARVVNTQETVEVPLARGKLDAAGKLAESGLWPRYLESLETMNPFPKPQDDAYRLYDIGVGYEAEAYQSEDHAAAKKLFDKAAINYGKALDENPSEKLFMEPQNRIELAVEHYRKLEANAAAAAAPPPPAEPVAAPAADSTASSASATPARSRSAATSSKSSSTKSASSGSASHPSSGSSRSASAPAKKPPMTNDSVIKMIKAGVDEDNVIATIHDAPSVKFDLSDDGVIQLAQNGVKGKVVTAMRERSKRSAKPATTQ
jgi:hypothetical protein